MGKVYAKVGLGDTCFMVQIQVWEKLIHSSNHHLPEKRNGTNFNNTQRLDVNYYSGFHPQIRGFGRSQHSKTYRKKHK